MDAQQDTQAQAAERVMEMVAPTEARVNITWARQNGDLPQTVHFDSPDASIRQWITEAVRAGSVPGITADPGADFTDFIVDKFPADEQVPYNRIMIRPKTAFG